MGVSTVGAFGVPHFEAALTEQCCLLIAQHTGDRNTLQPSCPCDMSKQPRGWLDGWQHLYGDVKLGGDLWVPLQRMQIHHQCPRSIGDIRGMHLALREVPDKPGVDITEQCFTSLGIGPKIRYGIQQIHQLAG